MKTRTSAMPAMLLTMLIFAGLLASMAILGGCSRDEPEPEGETKALKRAKEVQTMATPSNDSAGAWGGPAEACDALPGMIDLGRGKCIPCKKMEPILKELKVAYAGKAWIEIMNLDEHPDAADKYGLRLIPTQIFFDAAGSEVWRHEGFLSGDAMVAKFTEMGVEPVDD